MFIDDATGQLCALCFVQAETVQAYMETLTEHLARHGRPAAFSDRHSIFTTQQGEDRGASQRSSHGHWRLKDIELPMATSLFVIKRQQIQTSD